MFDTVRIRISGGLFVPKDQTNWESREYSKLEQKPERTTANTVLVSTQNGITMEIRENGRALTVEACLPKLLYGNNISTISRPSLALKKLRSFIRGFVEGPIICLADSTCLRIDYCHNFNVGGAISDYLSALSKIPFSRQRIGYNGAHSLEWSSNNGRRVIVYDKHLQLLETEGIDVPEANGTLRFEVQIRRRSKFLQRRLQTEELLTGDVLSPALAYSVLSETLAQMGFDKPLVPIDEARSILDSKFPPAKARRLYGFLCRVRSQSVEEIRRTMKRATFYDAVSELKKAGAWPPSMSVKLPGLKLPPLSKLLADHIVEIGRDDGREKRGQT